jgi:peroxiredoxin
MRHDIRPGATLPDYELPDHTDVKRSLSFLQGDDPMIVMLGRGMYCPRDRQQLHQLVAFQDQLAVGLVRLVTITTDTLMGSIDLRLGVGAHWPFLHDEERIIQRDLEIQEYTDPHHDPMIPHTFVLEPGLKIFRIYNGYTYWGRPSSAELHQDLRDISQRIRPDHRIDTDEMRGKWEAGEKGDFFPYGRRFRTLLGRITGTVDRFEP